MRTVLRVGARSSLLSLRQARHAITALHARGITTELCELSSSGDRDRSMVKAAAANGWLDERAAMIETLTAIKRAGAAAVITYFAVDAALILKGAEHVGA